MTRRQPTRPCSSCQARRDNEAITVRMYRKRSQMEFQYFLCIECRDILHAFLEGGSEYVTRSLFDHRAGFDAPAMEVRH